MGEFYLAHAGRSKRDGAKIGSGRYPLGSGDRPYQGDPAKAARVKRERKGLFGRKKKNKAVEETELTAEKKQRIIDTGDIKSAYAYRRYLTNSDIDAVVLRYQKEKSLADLLPKKKKGKDYVNNAADALNLTFKLINAGTNVWNTAARISAVKNPDNHLPLVPSLDDLKKKAAGK